MGEKYWVAAHTVIEAMQIHSQITDTDLMEYDHEDDVIELPFEKWKYYKVTDPEDRFPNRHYGEGNCPISRYSRRPITFQQWMNENHTPDMIATTQEP